MKITNYNNKEIKVMMEYDYILSKNTEKNTLKNAEMIR